MLRRTHRRSRQRRQSGSRLFALTLLLACLIGFAPSCSSETFGYDSRPLEAACKSPNRPPAFHLEAAFDNVTIEHPTDLVLVNESFYFGVSQNGKVLRIHRENDGWHSDVFLDVAYDLAGTDSETGLLSIAPAPDFATSHVVYVAYIARGTAGPFRLGVYRFRSDGLRADPASKTEIFALDRNQPTHYGGKIRFGPDGYLYISVGDGAPSPSSLRAQNPDEFFGKILRVDVSGVGDDGKPYRIPADNPFVGKPGRPEIYAMGLRNAWGLWFDDRKRLWVVDVGSERYEEIDIIVKGGNYGWPYREATSCYWNTPCESPLFIDPVVVYPHVNGFAAIGGFIYNGSVPELKGRFVYGDYISGRVWSADGNDPKLGDPQPIFFDTGLNISALVADAAGEILILDWAGNRVQRIAPTAPRVPRGTSLRALGCLDPASNELARDLVPYDVNAALWSDGAAKKRMFTMPHDAKIKVAPDDTFELPHGSMLLKEFSLGGKKIETRMMVRDEELDWLFYTFKWNQAGTDAELVSTEGADVPTPSGETWHIPSQSQCLACHGAQVGRVRGFEIAQLNRDIVYPNGSPSNQLATLGHVGYFDRDIDPKLSTPLPNPFGTTDTLENRARSYLHANCSQCHSVFVGLGGFNLTKWQALGELGIICKPSLTNTFGIQDARIVYPGYPEKSLLVRRMTQVGPGQMPPLGRAKVDTEAVKLVSDWIREMTPGCP